ncbi:hypothetical protein B0A52_03809 [Exophiala mesophila]|uniref:Ion transport domain-containing protein n=1 Tax=Exophiala mesophila TaxID=212818 RepID=A0A438N7S9_EXOME|nr:hypothetical protein B0A52_03809 [Exophiala mesophila]
MAPSSTTAADDNDPHFLSSQFRTFSWQMRQHGPGGRSIGGPGRSETDPLLPNHTHDDGDIQDHTHQRQSVYSAHRSYTAPSPSLRATSFVSEPEVDNQPGLADGHDQQIEEASEVFADRDGLYPPNCTWTSDQGGPPRRADPYRNAECNVYENIHRIRRDIINAIDDPYSLEQLKAPRMNITVVRPIVNTLYEMQDLSVVYCLLVNRMQFIREQYYAAHHQTTNLTRALLCEMLAEKILRRYNENNPGPRGLLKLANILVGGFEPFQGAPDQVCEQNVHAMHWAKARLGKQVDRKLTALEVAIISESKSFLSSSACQKVVDAIYQGKVVYTPTSFFDIIPDKWKRRPISLYDPRRAPILNQYRLIVPRTRNLIEVCQFIILLILYVAVMTGRESRMTTHFSAVEAIFDIYAIGWILDQVASVLEHGWAVYTQNLWSFLDVMFSTLFLVYLVLRIHAAGISDPDTSVQWARSGLDVLSCAAPVLIPRLAFNFMSENVLFVSLRAMISDFMTLTILAVWCFAGFLLSLKWLHEGAHEAITISKWMIWIWFGLDGTGIGEAPDFHWLLGPVLMVMFAFLGNTLFLTILVSMLSNTFSNIVVNAVQEVQFRRAVLTFEGVKSDAIFSYMPPFNILALLFMLPLKWTVSDRIFHKINVTAVRVLNLPLLLMIAWFERRTLWRNDRRRNAPRRINWKDANGPSLTHAEYWAINKFSVHGDIRAVFEIDPPQSLLNKISADDDTVDQGAPLENSVKDHWDFGVQSRNNSAVPDKPRKVPNIMVTKARRESKTSENLSKEFADSDEDNGGLSTGYRGIRRAERKDSMLDLGNDDRDQRLMEATARLHQMEQTMARVERMISRLLEADVIWEHGEGEEKAERVKKVNESRD